MTSDFFQRAKVTKLSRNIEIWKLIKFLLEKKKINQFS